jgi:primase-polymerase (primpol)-like protein
MSMLADLQQWPNWLCHNGDKIPRRIRDKDLASPTSRDDWASWQDACEFLRQHSNDGWGLGFVITKETGLTCIDLDRKKAFSAEVQAFQTNIFNTFRNTYAEFSVSGNGLPGNLYQLKC